MNVLEWISVDGSGLSAKTIACAALGQIPERPDYPHDGDDFGRCYRLLAAVPEARAGLDALGVKGGSVWIALVSRWSEIEKAYLYDKALSDAGENDHKKYKCYDLMQSIIRPVEDASGRVFRGRGFTIRT
ncbi:MAG: hypothetical protein KGL39_04745 [Patescibacteria group bacterium]|nr:hypothetical protein [Patescibacteria group bacterium]